MKSATAIAPRTRYRNEVVFRSAQRLVASCPVARGPRWGILAGGALAVFGLGVLVGVFWPRALPGESIIPVENVAVQEGPPTKSAAAEADVSPSGSVAWGGGSWSKAAFASGPGGILSSDDRGDGLSSAVPIAARRGDGAVKTTVPQTATTTVWWMLPVSEVTLQGTLHIGGDASLRVELYLRRNGAEISGVVRYFSDDGQRIAANSVAGEIDASILTLRETGRAWARSRAETSVEPSWLEPRKKFYFELPETDRSGAINGTWFLAGSSGELTLSPVLPW